MRVCLWWVQWVHCFLPLHWIHVLIHYHKQEVGKVFHWSWLVEWKLLMPCFGYLRKCTGYVKKKSHTSNVNKESLVYAIWKKHNINIVNMSPVIGFSGVSWQDCLQYVRSTCGYNIFIEGGIIEEQFHNSCPSSIKCSWKWFAASKTSCCNYYDFEFLGTSDYNENGCPSMIPSILLVIRRMQYY